MLSLIAAALGVYGMAALLGVALGRRALVAVYGASALAAAATALAAARFLAQGAVPEAAVLPLGLPWLGAHFRIDALSAFFLFVLGTAGTLASIFALGYAGHDREPGRILPFYPAFLAGMSLVLVADDALSFLMTWEFMSLASWLLVLATHGETETRRAALLYLVMANFGVGMLLLAFGLLSAAAATMPSPPCAARRCRRGKARSSTRLRSSVPARKRASCHCMSGCRRPMPPRQATFRR